MRAEILRHCASMVVGLVLTVSSMPTHLLGCGVWGRPIMASNRYPGRRLKAIRCDTP